MAEFIIPYSPDFSPDLIFSCGQCFRFERDKDGVWTGVAFGKVLTVKPSDKGFSLNCGKDDYELIWRRFFDMDTDYEAARRVISVSPFITEAAAACAGIRILRQEFWEALCSFIISQCNNIPRIKGIIKRLCGGANMPFPNAEAVADMSVSELKAMGMGYRAPYVLSAAKAVANGDITAVSSKPDLLKLNGVGEKVAACVMLYGQYQTDAFPIDVWMRRALDKYFPKNFDPVVFGEYAGIAQQYIFHYIRTME